jgi:uncharacterized protein
MSQQEKSEAKADAPSKRRGFAALPPEVLREIASKGGKAAQACGRAHRWDYESASIAGRKGAQARKSARG